MTNHNGENNGSHSGLEDPEERQTKQLDESEEMDLPQWDVPQVDQVWLVFGRHEEQLEPVHKLRKKIKKRAILKKNKKTTNILFPAKLTVKLLQIVIIKII